MLLSVSCRERRSAVDLFILAGLFLGLGLALFSNSALASIDYLIDVKDTEDELPSSTVTAVEQTPDGYLWIGTHNGLSRFDGERFVTFHPVNTPALTQAR